MAKNSTQDMSLSSEAQEKLLDDILNKIKRDKKIEYPNLPDNLEQWKVDLVALEMVNLCLYNINLNEKELRKLLDPTTYKKGAGSAGVAKEFDNEFFEKLASDIFPYIMEGISKIPGSAYTTLSDLNTNEPDKPSRQARLVENSASSPSLLDRNNFLRQASKTVAKRPSKITISSDDKSLKIGFESWYYSQNKSHLNAIALTLNNRPKTNEELADDIEALLVSSKQLTSQLVINPAGNIENLALSAVYSHLLKGLIGLDKVNDIVFDNEKIEDFLKKSDNQELKEVYKRTIAQDSSSDAKVTFIKSCLGALCLSKANDDSSIALCKYVDGLCRKSINPTVISRPGAR